MVFWVGKRFRTEFDYRNARNSMEIMWRTKTQPWVGSAIKHRTCKIGGLCFSMFKCAKGDTIDFRFDENFQFHQKIPQFL